MRAAVAPALAVAALAALAATLQGCGGSKNDSETTQTTTTLTTTSTTKTAPAPMPPAPEKPLRPLRSICYQALPGKSQSTQLPGMDMMQEGYASQWGPEGRDDLGMVSTLGGNAVRVYHGLGLEFDSDHGKFLDRAHDLGLSVLVGFHTTNVCSGFDCFTAWKDAALKGFKAGFAKDGKWHPAVKMVILMDQPDLLNFFSSDKDPTPPNCSALDMTDAQCRVKAVLSAMDGLLDAEREAGVNGTDTLITAAWSFSLRDSIDGQVVQQPGLYGFQDMLVGTEDPSLADYDEKVKEGLAKAFQSRWAHSLNAPSTWAFIKEKVNDVYTPYQSRPWFIAEFTPSNQGQDLLNDLTAMDAEAKKGGPFMGLSFNGFQKDYQAATPSVEGLFGLGDAPFPDCNPCQTDVLSLQRTCAEFPVTCLDASAGVFAAEVSSAWGGSAEAHGMCLKDALLMF